MWQARSENTDIPTLLIPAIRVADSGFYLCVATSPTGTAQARIQVVVLSGMGSPSRAGIMGKGEPRLRHAYSAVATASGASSVPVRIESSSPSVTEGQTLDLNCAVMGLTYTQVTWYKRGGSLPPHAQVGGFSNLGLGLWDRDTGWEWKEAAGSGDRSGRGLCASAAKPSCAVRQDNSFPPGSQPSMNGSE